MDSIIPQDDTPLKQCYRCKVWKFPTFEYFYHSKKTPDGLCISCKDCYNQRDQYRRQHPKEPDILPDGYKRCTGCKEIFPATPEFFHRATQRKSGLSSRCKECNHKGINDHYKRNSERLYEEHKQYRKANPHVIRQIAKRRREKTNAYQRKWKKDHADEIRVQQRKYQESHAEDISRWHREWAKEHPEEIRLHAHNYRARKKEVEGEYTTAQIQEQLKRQDYHCYYARCGFAKFERVKENGKWKYLYHIDHTYPLTRIVGTDIPGNNISYLVLSCHSCNESKGNKFPWEFFEGGRLL